VGDQALLAYRLPDGEIIEGTKDALAEKLRSIRTALDGYPTASLEVAEFVGDAKWARNAQHAVRQWLDEHAPGLVSAWTHWGPASWYFDSLPRIPLLQRLDTVPIGATLWLLAFSLRALVRRRRPETEPLGMPRCLVELGKEVHPVEPAFRAVLRDAIALQKLQEHERAIPLFEKALRTSATEEDVALARFLYAKSLAFVGSVEAGLSQYRLALDLARRVGKTKLAGQIHLDLASLHARAGNLAEAGRSARVAERTFRRESRSAEYGDVLLTLSRLDRSLGRTRRARSRLARALSLEKSIGNDVGEADALYELGVVAFYSGDQQTALRSQQSALAVYIKAKSRIGEAFCTLRTAQLRIVLGSVSEGRELVEKSLSLFEQTGYRHGQCIAVNELMVAHIRTGRLAEAIECGERARSIAENVGDDWTQARVLTNLGNVHAMKGDLGKAEECESAALKLYVRISDPYGRARSENNLALIYLERGESGKAMRFYRRARARFAAMGDVREEAATLLNIGYANLESTAARPRTAIRFFLRAKRAAAVAGDLQMVGYALNNIGEAYYERGYVERAAWVFCEALRVLEQVGDPQGTGHALGNLAAAIAERGDTRRGTRYYRSAMQVLEEHDMKVGMAEVMAKWGLALLHQGEKDAAKSILEHARMLHGECGVSSRWARRVDTALAQI
jgi:tetratricopeptide (TPR) repeat protein